MGRSVRDAVERAGLKARTLPEGLRVRKTATHRFWINYSAEDITHDGRVIPSADVLWEEL